ncbi:MAG: hypothetical protein R3B70_11595 [Polyangiaceae bacterium]
MNGYCVLAASLPVGSVCAANNECASGQCVDGVCCATACGGLCMACNVSYHGVNGMNGTCLPILVGLDPQDECSGPGKAAKCSGASAANGNSSCGIN